LHSSTAGVFQLGVDLPLSDYHLSVHLYLKNWLGSQLFNNNEDGRCQNMAELIGGRLLDIDI
jgi:hypothetical protein